MWEMIAEAEKVAARMGLSVLSVEDSEDTPIPEGAMRVGPGTDAVVWRTCPTHKAQA